MSKLRNFRRHFSTFVLTRGLTTALLGSAFIYLDHWGFSLFWLNSILGISFLYLLLSADRTIWPVTGFFIGIFWFWWIALSFNHYHMPWAVPIVVIVTGLLYGTLFWAIAFLAEKIPTINKSVAMQLKPTLFTLSLKALGLLGLSYIHPFGFDWFKPELIFVESYFGIQKWQFAIILAGIVLTLWKKQYVYLFLVLFAWQPLSTTAINLPQDIRIVTTYTSVEEKWDKTLHPQQFNTLFTAIDKAIDENKSLVILPESVFPVFLKRSASLMQALEQRSGKISIVAGGLYWDGKTPRNSTYIFTDSTVRIANKVLLVPFGESNPLPDFLSDWVNKVFYDGAVDYKADSNVTDYTVNDITYRNAICFEATSEKLYEGRPRNMIVLSNNGWFTPSIEPTLQKLLLQYYSRKYGTTIYHAVNMAESYIVQNGRTRSIP
ncbi:apolipoprotein N-acyltransferase [Sulfurovum sp. NBC37-1]|uniref:apolipoprotein N-acyltransferase n=1 Tax=Sulfurovum sp. (strain NBC37-1) TaxID=387093 RepID=UPI00015877F7|nr:apolipoprotein N-acyltransferase [Sulfurovum sp. NBC37-1]BAF71352.1 apolipoprotein N-acyltransferase [Sulfurovum sp. NBC37-1]